MTIPIILAGINRINAENALRSLIPSRTSVNQAMIFFGALSLVALLFFFSAIVFRPRPHRRHVHHRRPRPALNSDFEATLRKLLSPQTYHRRRRHTDDFPLNPTLAEVGGLPPLRNKDQSPSLV